ncbi:guanine nucleotide-binding protein g(o) subunit alpha [Anaeramoeba ignava]|uniref:Guanine nucleotide-binding protein g(O) subunit alpha n=1 Tax=Anaeramoeba ignava TaxID=1746090 RepID=A0A9Q0LWE0_ANAIG|nr:guanine nucleotide-binding protein g(o) subunit alpha [Anaeramoeba ignava]
MGSSKSKNKAKKLQKNQSVQIDKQLSKEKEKLSLDLSILLLGTGESGKTTFIKQASILYKGGFNELDKQLYPKTIRRNAITYMKELISAAQILELDLPEEIEQAFFQFRRFNLFQNSDQQSHIFDDIERVSQDDYEPTDKDILFCRIPTTGINFLTFEHKSRNWKVIDVGGQRSERRKWIHTFDNVNFLIYVVAINEFDQALFEEHTQNRMQESLEFFSEMVNNQYFKDKNCILLFNKMDLFKAKIQKVDLNVCFPEYNGGKNYENALSFIQKTFLSVAQNSNRTITPLYVCATETKEMQDLFEQVFDIILKHLN